MGGRELKCASGGCGRDAFVISGRTGQPVCRRCHEEIDLVLPHVPLRARWRAWRHDVKLAREGSRLRDDFRISSWRKAWRASRR